MACDSSDFWLVTNTIYSLVARRALHFDLESLC